MTFNEYQKVARQFATGGGAKFQYAMLGLAEEAGEACGKYAKFIRKRPQADLDDAKADKEFVDSLKKELGDCLWMIANACAAIGLSLDAVAMANIRKLTDRAERGVIVGEGDDR